MTKEEYNIYTKTHHHIVCSFFIKPAQECKYCQGDTGYWNRYPSTNYEDSTIDGELISK